MVAQADHSHDVGGRKQDRTLTAAQPQAATLADAPVHTGPSCNARNLPTEVTFQRRCPRDEAETEPVVDHDEPARRERQALTVNPSNVLAISNAMRRKSRLRCYPLTGGGEFALPERVQEVAGKQHTLCLPPG